MRKYINIIIVGVVFLSSCKIGQRYKQPEIQDMPDSFAATTQTLDSITVGDIGWTTLYSDPALKELIFRALENNKDMKIAAARIKELAANKRISFANMMPSIGVEGLFQKEALDYKSSISPKHRGQFTLNWELDLWGNLRWANDASVAEFMQSVEAQRGLHLTIVSQVAQMYFELTALDRELAIVKQTLVARQESSWLAKLRYEGGLTSEIPYRQSLVELARTETMIPSLENKIQLKENDLAVLVGAFPSTLIPRGMGLNKQFLPENLPVDLPSTLLKRRPDIIEAEQKLIKANAKVGMALTSIFPNVKLTGKYGVEDAHISSVLKNPAWWLSGTLLGPVFNFGKNKAMHKAAKAAYEQEVYSYENKILNIFKEVNNAIVTFDKSKEVRKSREELYNSAKSYYELARLQYINGVVNYIDVLDSQRQLFDAEISLNDALLNELTSTVTLYKALGGGIVE